MHPRRAALGQRLGQQLEGVGEVLQRRREVLGVGELMIGGQGGDQALMVQRTGVHTWARDRRADDAEVEITDLAGDGNHYAAEVIDESFRGKNRVQQQRAVYAALRGQMDGPAGALHALALTTKAPD